MMALGWSITTWWNSGCVCVRATISRRSRSLGQYAFVAQALLDGRRDAEPVIVVDGRELAMRIDRQAARVVLGFEQEDVPESIEDQVVDLRHVAIHYEPQVVQDEVVLAVLEIAVDVVRRVALTLNALLQARDLFAQPLLLRDRKSVV